jgi:hypothetical protein
MHFYILYKGFFFSRCIQTSIPERCQFFEFKILKSLSRWTGFDIDIYVLVEMMKFSLAVRRLRGSVLFYPIAGHAISRIVDMRSYW